MEDPVDPVMLDRRCFTSATAPETAGLLTGADLTVAEDVFDVGRVVVLDENDLTAGFGLDELAETDGFLVAAALVVPPALFSAKLSTLTGV